MKFLDKITRNEARFQRYIGLSFKQLDLLTQRLEATWNKAEFARLNRKGRTREVGGGHPYKLKQTRDKIIAALLYYKQYITQELLGDLIEVDQANISRLLKKMLPLIEEAADPALKIYLAQAKDDCQNRIGTLRELYERHPDLRDVSTDANEQQCFRSQNYEIQKKYYSGKSKQHTIKTQISVTVRGRILDVSKSYPGSIHDKKIIDEEKTIEKFDKRVPHRFDSGYQGIKKEHPDHYLILPAKKPKGRELLPIEKEHNRANSKRRIIAEHTFARIQKFRICATTFRQPLSAHNQTFRNIVALLNFKLECPMAIK
jgi:hypothetical protein